MQWLVSMSLYILQGCTAAEAQAGGVLAAYASLRKVTNTSQKNFKTVVYVCKQTKQPFVWISFIFLGHYATKYFTRHAKVI